MQPIIRFRFSFVLENGYNKFIMSYFVQQYLEKEKKTKYKIFRKKKNSLRIIFHKENKNGGKKLSQNNKMTLKVYEYIFFF